MYTTFINVKTGYKYLSEVLPFGLPTNCLFDKVLTGCGGTYVALTDPSPYIVAVPTKALVRDKVESSLYKPYNVQGVSEDYPLTSDRSLSDCSKIITTYKSLPQVASRVDISKYRLLVDEVHMLSSMTSYARDELKWLMGNYSKFLSYCFMSATVPRREHLLPELRDLKKVKVVWEKVVPVNFECYLAENIQESILKIILEHVNNKRPGRPYIFYNSVEGTTNILKKWKGQSVYKTTFNIVCSNIESNQQKLSKVGHEVGTPNAKADVHFITATAFEGVDFYDQDGVTYIISDKNYATTKYSIETTIPQIVGRLRDSKYNSKITVIFDKDSSLKTMTPREFSEYLDTQESQAKGSIKVYKELAERVKSDPSLRATLKNHLAWLENNNNVLVEGAYKTMEEFVCKQEYEEDELPEVSFYPYARVVAQQTYDLFHEERYIQGQDKGMGNPLSLGKLKGKALGLSEEEASIFKFKAPTLKQLCDLYSSEPDALKSQDPDWFKIIETLGVEVCKAKNYSKSQVKTLYKGTKLVASKAFLNNLYKTFNVGDIYSRADIKLKLATLKAPSIKASTLSQWFEIKSVNYKGKASYKIIRKL